MRGKGIVAAVSLEGFRVWSMEVKDVSDYAPPGVTTLRVTAIVGDDRRPIHRDVSFSNEMLDASPPSHHASLIFEALSDMLQHELVEKYRFAGRPIRNPHPEDPDHCKERPWLIE